VYKPFQDILDAAATYTTRPHHRVDDYANLLQLHLKTHAHRNEHNPKELSVKDLLMISLHFIRNLTQTHFK